MKTSLSLLGGLACMAGLASASMMYSTSGEFLSDSSSSITATSGGATVTLTYNADGVEAVGVPSNIDLGNFELTCIGTCSPTVGVTLASDTFDLMVDDVTDGATGEFVGTMTGGEVFSNVSPISISWAPLVIGPGTTNVQTGNFGPTFFTITSPTGIVAPNSGGIPGDTTVQAAVSSTAVPEPATIGMLGAGLLGFGLVARKRKP